MSERSLNITSVLLPLAFAIAGMLIAGGLAQSKGRNPLGYWVLGFLCPCVGVIVALVVPDLRRRRRR